MIETLLFLEKGTNDMGWKMAIMVVLLIAVFYFFMLRPQQEQAKKVEAYRDSRKKGDRVLMSNGIHGEVFSTDKRYATVEVAPGCRFKVLKTTLAPLKNENQ